jgi:hypothetical protein
VQRFRKLLADNNIAISLDPDQLVESKSAVVTELSADDYYPLLAVKAMRIALARSSRP